MKIPKFVLLVNKLL